MSPRLFVAKGKLWNGDWWNFTVLQKLGSTTTLKATAGTINLNFVWGKRKNRSKTCGCIGCYIAKFKTVFLKKQLSLSTKNHILFWIAFKM